MQKPKTRHFYALDWTEKGFNDGQPRTVAFTTIKERDAYVARCKAQNLEVETATHDQLSKMYNYNSRRFKV